MFLKASKTASETLRLWEPSPISWSDMDEMCLRLKPGNSTEQRERWLEFSGGWAGFAQINWDGSAASFSKVTPKALLSIISDNVFPTVPYHILKT